MTPWCARELDLWGACADEELQAMPGESVRLILDASLAPRVELDPAISPQILLPPSLGHTLGHLSVLIKSEGERAVVTRDRAHHPLQMAHPGWSLGDDGASVAALTRLRLFAEWADQPLPAIGTHFAAPTAGHGVRDGAALRFAV